MIAGRPMVFMFFVSGKPSKSFSDEEYEQMQATHLDNNRTLHEAGITKITGPCADPDKIKRGIILFDLPSDENLATHFTEDPYVRNGILEIVSFPVSVSRLELGCDSGEGITQHSIGLLEADSAARELIFPDTTRYLSDSVTARPSVVASATGDGAVRLVVLFADPDVDKIQSILSTDPLIASGALRARTFKQWAKAGILK